MPTAYRLRKYLADNIRRIRKERALTQEALAELSDLTAVYISELERTLKSPTLDSLEKLSNGLKCPAHDLIRPHDSLPTGRSRSR